MVLATIEGATRQNNVQGSARMGCDPGILTESIAVDECRPSTRTPYEGDRKGKNRRAVGDFPRPSGSSKLRDRFTLAPEFKVTAVRIDKIDPAA